MPIFIDGNAYDYTNTDYVPGYNRLFGTERTVSGDLARVDTTVLERTFTFTLICNLAKRNTLLTSYLKASTIAFIDDEDVTYDVYFMGPLKSQMVSPLSTIPCNDYTIDVTFMVNGQT